MREYIFQEIDNVQASPERQVERVKPPNNGTFELKLNVTDSEFVLVENSSQGDSNAVILKVRNWFLFKVKKCVRQGTFDREHMHNMKR